MEQVINFFKKLFDPTGFPPRWHCGTGWDDFTGWLYILSDFSIWAAYFAIPLIIIRYITRRHDARFTRIYFLFASFILACGTTHLVDVIIFWHPVYRFSALVRFVTGIVSWLTVIVLVKLLPTAFSLKSAQELESEVEQRKRAEERLRLQNEMLNEAQEIARMGYWQWDVLHDRITWSDNLYRMYGLRPGMDINYEVYLNIVHPEDREFVLGNIQSALDKGVFEEFYHRILLPDGQVRNIHSKGTLLRNEQGEVVKMIGTAQDVTEQKLVEQELLSKTQDLEATNVELQKFASVVSHDLREPLRKIITFASMLDKEIEDPESKARLYSGKISGSAVRMQQLIEDILNFSYLNAQDVQFSRVDINAVIDQVLSDMEVQISDSAAKIEVGRIPAIEGNASQIGQLFQNLLSNAIKFHQPDVPPQVSVFSEMLTGNQLSGDLLKSAPFSVLSNPKFWEHERFVKIYVQDHGIGFDPAYVDRIFNIFQRLHTRSEYEGTGIGLAICKKIIDIHHGSITASSVVGSGATFVIILPVSQRNFRGSNP